MPTVWLQISLKEKKRPTNSICVEFTTCVQCKQAGATFSVYPRRTQAAFVADLRICSAAEKRRSDETGSLCSEMTRRAKCLFWSERRLLCFGFNTKPELGDVFKLSNSGTRFQNRRLHENQALARKNRLFFSVMGSSLTDAHRCSLPA